MKRLQALIIQNKATLLAMLIGLILGYLHWYFWGCYWGTYPMSAEMWTNCCAGSLSGGFVASLL
ncbi:hypothetical protein [Dysgonomonas mossii]|uniref:Uncharacterized protein n=1 Tax=Dysgonomonas mossii DSM 22836 TaxID=742767 RepID=F8X3X4_9BACT|nr:hypothetical protein [Dysgonomonas mossii]EGK05263.1 hypothetical protein HMPREF9456_02933 [Dysgonomonas mossii DSM 22836]